MSVARSIDVRIWNPADRERVAQFVTLLNHSMGHQCLTEEQFLWKHRDNPYGHSIISYAICQETESLAAMRAFWAWNICREGQSIQAFQPCETVTHPDFRRRGLFTVLTNRAITEAVENGGAILFNFPNGNSKPGYLKLGWRDMGQLVTLVKPVLGFRSAAKQLRQLGCSLKKIGTEASIAKSDEKWVSALTDQRAFVYNGLLVGGRDRQMLSWRLKKPDAEYRAVHCKDACLIVLLRKRKQLIDACIVDGIVSSVSGHGENQIGEILSEIGRVIAPSAISAIMTAHHPMATLLAANGFRRVSNQTSFVTRGLTASMDFEPGDQWALSGLDLDTY